MRPRQPRFLPRLWLMTDESMGDALFAAIRALPRQSGIVFRHYSLPSGERRALLAKVERIARRHGHLVTIGGTTHARKRGAITAPVHSIPERIAAERAGAKLIFVSPVFATQSHPRARPLGRVRFGLLIRGARLPVIALGGMTSARARSLEPLGIYGWAAISAMLPVLETRP
jgi:thiamine-phosphate pyrophosphorylase